MDDYTKLFVLYLVRLYSRHDMKKRIAWSEQHLDISPPEKTIGNTYAEFYNSRGALNLVRNAFWIYKYYGDDYTLVWEIGNDYSGEFASLILMQMINETNPAKRRVDHYEINFRGLQRTIGVPHPGFLWIDMMEERLEILTDTDSDSDNQELDLFDLVN